TQIGAALRARAAAAAPAKQIAEAEELAEDVAEILKYSGIKARAGGWGTHSRMAEAVVQAALLAVCQDRIGFTGLLELLFGLRIIGIAVRVILQRQLAVGAFDLLLVRVPRDAQYFVVVSFYVAW